VPPLFIGKTMSIISKPAIVYKGTPAEFTLFKTNLLNNHIVSSNSTFNSFSKWSRVYLNYKSSEGNQRINVVFDDSDSFFKGTFSASERARDSFLIDYLMIVDLDGEVLKIDRNNLNVLDFDIQLNIGSESEEFVLLLEDGDAFLLESGEFLVL
jgi:hypothetical protein